MTKEELEKAVEEKTWLYINNDHSVLIRADHLRIDAVSACAAGTINKFSSAFECFRVATPNDMLKYDRAKVPPWSMRCRLV